MDDDMRMRKLELTVHNHNRRLDDHDKLHVESRKDIAMLQDLLTETRKQTGILLELAPSIKNLEDYAGKTYDVVRPLKKIVSVVLQIAAGFLVIWHAAKWLYAKAVLFT